MLNQPVKLTSPRVTISTQEELVNSFDIPYMNIYVRFIEGLSGYNLLMVKLTDVAKKLKGSSLGQHAGTKTVNISELQSLVEQPVEVWVKGTLVAMWKLW
ncbi:MAG: hypothetical protein PHT62_02775 [Desulfotomaculaceae bacterium]|nr:hypothetical protein [Desulfotomaculaceae bacterium]